MDDKQIHLIRSISDINIHYTIHVSKVANATNVYIRLIYTHIYLYGFMIPFGSYRLLICFMSLIIVSLRLYPM